MSPSYVPPAAGCIDQQGRLRQPQDVWVDDDVYPCVFYGCPKGGGQYTVDDVRDECTPEPVTLGDCIPSRNPGQCCFNYTCHGGPDVAPQAACVDSTGQLRPPGDVWNDDDNNTCVTYVCANGVVKVVTDLRILCKASLPQEAHCQPYRAAGDCCYSYNCTITTNQTLCRDSSGSYRRDGDYWYDDVSHPCVKYVCRAGETEIEYDLGGTCSPPKPGCRAFRPSGACCYNYTCGCQYRNVTYSEGEKFVDDVQHPCRQLRCDNSVVVTVAPLEICEVLSCAAQVRPLGECCRRCGESESTPHWSAGRSILHCVLFLPLEYCLWQHLPILILSYIQVTFVH